MAINSEIVSICLQRGTVPGCWTDPATDEKVSVLIAAAFDHNGEPIPAGTISPQDPAVDIGLVYLGTDGDALDPQPDPADVEAGPCCACGAPECIESREWTFGIDNTGTRFSWDVDITVTLSDGSDFTFQQTPTAGWSQQITLWAAEMQAAMPWTVSEPRCDLPAGCGGLPGTPTGVVLPNMFWRYANVQVCPGDPIPVKAEISAINGGGAPASKLGFVLASDGPIEGPLLTFRRCQNCGEEAVWYEEDGVTPVAEGLEPRCSWPCGLPPAPVPDALCQFDSQEGCDTTGSADPNDWISVVRVITICQGEEPQTNYYVEDTADPEGGLLEYTIIDDFLVDCETGEPIPEPVPECDQGETWCRRVDTAFIDNNQFGTQPIGLVAYRQDTFELTVTMSDGVSHVFTTGPHANYGAQMADIAAQLSALTGKPWTSAVTSPTDDGNVGTPYGTHATVECCPGDTVPVSTSAVTLDSPSASRIGRVIPELLTGVTPGDVETLLRCQCCDPAGAVTWYDQKNSVIDPPPEDCLSKSCDFPAIPARPEPSCTVTTQSVCEIQPPDFSDPDNEIPAVVITTDVFLNIVTCDDGTVTLDPFTLDLAGDPVPHDLTPGNFYGDCDTLLPLEIEDPSCPEDCDWKSTEWDIHAAAIDNNGWTGAGNPWGLIRPSWDATLEITLADGSLFIINQVGSANATTQLQQWADAFLADDRFCNSGIYCDNWPNCGRLGNPSAPVALGWTGNTDVAFGNYLFVESCDPSVLPVSAVVTAVSGPQNSAAALGATKDETGPTSVTLNGYECVTCDGKFFMDCDGNVIPAPCCCTRPPGSGGASLDCALTECGSEPTCAWGASPVEADAVFEAEEGGILWTFCDVEYQMPPGSYTLTEIQTWIAANTPHTAGIEPVDVKNVSFWFNLPCDCSGASFQIGDDAPTALAAIPEFDMDGSGGEGCALNVKLCDSPAVEFDIVTDEVCVDGAFATRYRGINPATGDLAGWERFEDGLGAEIPGPVTISDPCDCDCACNDSCAPEGCADVQCGILRLDADPASLSQSTLEGYTLEFTGTGFGAGCDSVNHSFGDETLTVVDIDGTNTIANFADVINAQLAGHGFTAAYCDERPGGGTATAGQGVAVQGPTCPGITWELKLDSGGSGDDYAIGWDGFSLHSHEWVSGVALTDPNNDYSLDGGWDIRDCGDCAP